MNQVDKIRQVVFTTREAMQCAFHKPYESESRRPGLTSQLPDPLVDTDSEGVGVTKSVRCEHVRVQSCQDVPSASNAAPFVSGIRGSKLWGPLITGPQHTTASCWNINLGGTVQIWDFTRHIRLYTLHTLCEVPGSKSMLAPAHGEPQLVSASRCSMRFVGSRLERRADGQRAGTVAGSAALHRPDVTHDIRTWV